MVDIVVGSKTVFYMTHVTECLVFCGMLQDTFHRGQELVGHLALQDLVGVQVVLDLAELLADLDVEDGQMRI